MNAILPLAAALSLALSLPAQQGRQDPPEQNPVQQEKEGRDQGKTGQGEKGQEPEQGPPAQPAGTGPAGEVAREPTRKERIAKLEAEVEKLRAELEALREIEAAGGIAGRVKRFLDERTETAEELQVELAQPVVSNGGERRGARLLGDAEKEELADDVIFTVDGVPVTQDEFDAAYGYLKSYPREDTDEQLKKLAIMELARVKAIQAAFPEESAQALERLREAEQRLESGADFATVAKELSDCPSAARGGALGQVSRIGYDPSFTRVAFSTPVGEVSDVVASTFGYHLIKVTGKQKGDTPGNDKVEASHVLELYHPNQARIASVTQRVDRGDVDLAFADDELRQYVPEVFEK